MWANSRRGESVSKPNGAKIRLGEFKAVYSITIVVVLTDFSNMAVMLSDLLRNLTFNRSAHCTRVSDQCPLGLLLLW